MLARAVATAAIALLGAAVTPRAADASSIFSFTKTSSGSIAFAVSDVNAPALAGSQAYGFTLQVQTGFSSGSVTLTAPAITGTAGNAIKHAAFSASCTATSDPGGIFASLGIVRLASTPVSCWQISPFSSNTVKFNVTLYIDKMAGSADAFSADTYTSGSLAVTANAP